jgi:hypothetical protein
MQSLTEPIHCAFCYTFSEIAFAQTPSPSQKKGMSLNPNGMGAISMMRWERRYEMEQSARRRHDLGTFGRIVNGRAAHKPYREGVAQERPSGNLTDNAL